MNSTFLPGRCREIVGLKWVERLEASPWPKTKHTGPALAGIRYQGRIAKALPKALAGPWFRFEDANGVGCCSPDLISTTPFGLLCIECKLTYNPEAQRQLFSLYLPVLRLFYGVEVLPLVVVKDLGRGYAGPFPNSTLSSAILAARTQYAGALAPVLLATLPSPAHVRHQFALGH